MDALTDDADTISKKIRKAKTDAEPLPDHLDGLKDRPEAKNLVNIYAALAGHTPAQVIKDFAGAQFGTFKPALADLAAGLDRLRIRHVGRKQNLAGIALERRHGKL